MVVQNKRLVTAVVSISLIALFVSTGCRSAREKAQQRRRPQNVVFEAKQQIPELELPEGQNASFTLWNQTNTQSIHLLQVDRDVKLTRRYHANHDMTLLCISGSAIVAVEQERHFVESPSAVVVPRLLSYEIIPHRTEEDFVALLVYSPTFTGEDTVLMEE